MQILITAVIMAHGTCNEIVNLMLSRCKIFVRSICPKTNLLEKFIFESL